MKTFETIILRTLMFIPFALMHLIFALHSYFRVMFLFCKYGGECIVYPKDRKFIADVYNLLEEKFK